MNSSRSSRPNIVFTTLSGQIIPAPPAARYVEVSPDPESEIAAQGCIQPDYMTPRQVFAMTGHTVKALDAMRHRKKGPKWLKVGSRIRYRRADIIAWMESGEHSPDVG